MSRPKHYCPIPFFSIELYDDHVAKLCCNSGRRFYFEKDLKDFWHSDAIESVREKMINDEWNSDCQLCYDREDLFNHSKRVDEIKQMGNHHLKKPLAMPTHLQLNLSNICNLKCIMCAPKYSTKWNEDVESLGKLRGNLYVEPVKKISERVLTTTIRDFINTRSFAEKTIEIYGGEPFLSKEFWRIIDNVPYQKLRNVRFKCNTNGTIMNDAIMKNLKKFKKNLINMSIDGVGEIFEFQRFPAKWEKVEKNMNILKKYGDKYRFKFTVDLYYTLSSFNAIGLSEFIDYCNEKGWRYYINVADNEPLPDDVPFLKRKTNSRVQEYGGKGFTHPCMLPQEVKEKILNEVEGKVDDIYWKKIKNSFFDTKGFSLEKLNNFKNYCDLIKEVRGLDFLEMLKRRYNYEYT